MGSGAVLGRCFLLVLGGLVGDEAGVGRLFVAFLHAGAGEVGFVELATHIFICFYYRLRREQNNKLLNLKYKL